MLSSGFSLNRASVLLVVLVVLALGYHVCAESECNTGWIGEDCSIPICFGILANDSTVCSSKIGQCIAPDTCECNTGYNGSQCNEYSCFGEAMNSSTVCSSHGACVAPNSCACKFGYNGTTCNEFFCFGTERNSSNICSSHGECIDFDICECQSNYYGEHCNITSCFGVFSNDTSVCTANGLCDSFDTCVCNSGWTGDCSIPVCNGTACNITQCYGILQNATKTCSGNGECISLDKCECKAGWIGENCSIPICFGMQANDSTVCSSSGSCVSINACKCFNEYKGEKCEIGPNSHFSYEINTIFSSKKPLERVGGNHAAIYFDEGTQDLYFSDGCKIFVMNSVGEFYEFAGSVEFNGNKIVLPGLPALYTTFHIIKMLDRLDTGEFLVSQFYTNEPIVQINPNTNIVSLFGPVSEGFHISPYSGIIFSFTYNTIHKVERNGQYAQMNIGFSGPITCICTSKNGTIYLGEYLTFKAINPHTGSISLFAGEDNYQTSIVQYPQKCLVTQDDEFYFLTQNGITKIVNGEISNIFSGKNLHDFALVSDGSIYISSFDLYSVSPKGNIGKLFSNGTYIQLVNNQNPPVPYSSYFDSMVITNGMAVLSDHRGGFTTLYLNNGTVNNVFNLSQFSGAMEIKSLVNIDQSTWVISWSGLFVYNSINGNIDKVSGGQFSKLVYSPTTRTLYGLVAYSVNIVSFSSDYKSYSAITTKIGDSYGDGIPALDAVFRAVYCLFVWNDGNSVDEIYVCDSFSIRKIKNGNVTTVAGGFLKSTPTGIICDNCNFSPQSIFVSKSGTIYFGDGKNNLIYKIGKDRNLEIVAGNGYYGYNGDGTAKSSTLTYPIVGHVDENTDTIYFIDNGQMLRQAKIAGCERGYYGQNCSLFSCFNKTQDNENVCHSRGVCVRVDECMCKEGYEGYECNSFKCFSFWNNDTNVCNGNGVCSDIDTCKCSNGWLGKECKENVCYGIMNSNSTVCSGHGTCISYNNCKCNGEWSGNLCDTPMCYGITSNNSNVCSSKGSCIAPDTCKCNTGYNGSQCDEILCFGESSKSNSVCSSHGTCTDFNLCTCKPNYFGEFCNITKCFIVLSNDSAVCSTNGKCVDVDNCKCNSGWFGKDCSIPLCFGTPANNSQVCSSKGSCNTVDTCECKSGYYGNYCNTTECFGIFSNSSLVCSSQGTCAEFNLCACNYGWTGLSCSNPICNGIPSSNSSVCSSHGYCKDVDVCECSGSFVGEWCQYNATVNDFTIQVYSPNNENLNYVNPSEDLILKCLLSTDQTVSYKWSTSYESSESTKSYLIIPNSVLQLRKNIIVTVEVISDIAKTSTIQVKVNEQPTLGNFVVTPSFGYTLETFFKLECNDSYDANLPLTFKYIYKLDTESEWKTLAEQSIEKSFITSLPEGNQQLAVIVFDSFMSYTQSNTITVQVSAKKDISLEALSKIETQTISIPLISSLSNIISTQNATTVSNEVTEKAVQIVSNFFSTQLEKETATANITSSKLSASVSSVSSVSKSFVFFSTIAKSVIMDYFRVTLQKAALSRIALIRSDYQTSLNSISTIEKNINSKKRVQQTIYTKVISIYRLLSETGAKSLLEDSSPNKIEGNAYQSYSKYLKGSSSLVDTFGQLVFNITSLQAQPCIVDVKTYVNELISTEFKHSKVFEVTFRNPSTFKQIDVMSSSPIAKFKFPFSTTTRSIQSITKDTSCLYESSSGTFSNEYCEFSSENGELVLSVSRTGLFVITFQESTIIPPTDSKPQNTTISSNGNSAMVIGIAIGVPVFILLLITVVIIIIVACFFKIKSKSKSNLELELSIMDTTNVGIEEGPVVEPFIIPSEQISSISKIGEYVYKAELTLRTTGEKKTVALQIVNGKSSHNDLKYMTEVDHQNLVHIYGISTINNQTAIVREYVEGQSIQELIEQLRSGKKVMDFDEKFDLLLQVALGVNYLHKLPNRLAHGDLKPSNCLIESDMTCKVCDFGLSKAPSKNTSSAQYLASELISGNAQKFSTPADAYSFAIIMWEVIFEESPYEYQNRAKFFFETDFQNSPYFNLNSNNFLPNVVNGLRPVIPFNQENSQRWLEQFHRSRFTVSTQVLLSMRQLMESCWHSSPSHRPSFEIIIKEITQIRSKLEYNMSVYV